MLNKLKLLLFISLLLISFQINISGKNNNVFTKIYDNGTICINLKEKINSNLKEYIKSGIPFNCKLTIEIKEYSNFFFIKDKILKKYEKHFKFSYDIIKKKYIIVEKGKYYSTSNYKEFLIKISNFEINDFLTGKYLNNEKYYCKLAVFYTPIKGGFSVKDIYIFPKIKEFIYKEDLKLEE